MEPDGLPNAAGVPTSTTQTNIFYHLALAHYLKGEYAQALVYYQRCRALSKNDDMLVATLDWEYMTLRRMGRHDEAAALLTQVTDKMTLYESFDYHKRLRMYQGKVQPDALMKVEGSSDPDLAYATQGYGLGNYYFYSGDQPKALGIYEKVLAGKHWSAFGYIAAEADMARLRKAQ